MLGDNVYGSSLAGKLGVPVVGRLLELIGLGKRGGHRDLFPERFDKYYSELRVKHGVRFHAVLGNHDTQTDHGRHEVLDRNRFGMAGPDGFYVYQPLGLDDLITFYALNSEYGQTVQRRWLEETLAQSKARWKIALFHSPIYTPPGAHRPKQTFRKEIEDVLISGGVQIVLAGHNHFYARMAPINKMINFVSGGGGARLYTTAHQNKCTAKLELSSHFLYMEADRNHVEFWAVHDPEGKPFDHGEITPSSLSQDACPPAEADRG